MRTLHIFRRICALAPFVCWILSITTTAAADTEDPWKLPFRGFRASTNGTGPSSTQTGGRGIPPIATTATTSAGARRDIHTLILTECANYQDWQTIAAAFAWRESGQPGNVTRVVNCPPDRTKSYTKLMMEVMPTFWAREYLYNAKIKDIYAAYNKPGAVVDFLAKAPAQERYVIVLDSDMLLHKPFLPEEFDIKPGWAVGSSGYNYLRGVVNDLAMRHVSSIAPRNDTLAGPVGRRGDQVGGPYFMLMDDLRRVAPLWLSATEEMRQDHEAWKDSGDKAAPGQSVWISEMYGYSFGAARAGVWHRGAPDFMIYPTFPPSRVPHVIHYGLHFHLNDDDWEFDKHSYLGFDPLKCPPWPSWQEYTAPKLRGLVGEALTAARLAPPPKPAKSYPTEGIFPPPPHPSRLKDRKKPFLENYRDLLAIFTVTQINAGLCEFHSWTCPWSAQLEAVCGDAWELYMDVREALDAVEFVWDCTDHKSECSWWAKSGECMKSAAYMRDHCAVSCAYCTPRPSSDFVPRERRALRFAAKTGAVLEHTRATNVSISDEKSLGRKGMGIPAGGEHPDPQQVESEANDGGAAHSALTSRMGFASLVERCATAFTPPLDHTSLGLCVRSAGLSLAYEPTDPGERLRAAQKTPRISQPRRDRLQTQDNGSWVSKLVVFTGAFSGTLMLVAWLFPTRQTSLWTRKVVGKYARVLKRAYIRKE